MNDQSKPPSPALSIVYSATAQLTVELAKMLALVAPTSMSEEQQELWLRAAVDALDGIRGSEVNAIAAELKRSVTRHNQIVPEIARLVSEKRQRASRMTVAPVSPEWSINQEAQRRRGMARNTEEVEAAWKWERLARIDAGLHVAPIAPPLSRRELEIMPKHLRDLGISRGLLEYRDGQLVEVS